VSDLTGDERNDNEQYSYDYRVTLLRVMPKVTFGLQAAALAGLAVSAAAVAMGLAGVFDDSAVANTYTTCSKGDAAMQ
jgi:hypothetical protein